MKKIILCFFVMFLFFIKTFASDVDTLFENTNNSNTYSSNIDALNEKIDALNKKIDSINESMKYIQLEKYSIKNKYEMAIIDSNNKGDRQTASLTDEMILNIGICDKKIGEYNLEIENLNIEKKNLIKDLKQAQLDKKNNEYWDYVKELKKLDEFKLQYNFGMGLYDSKKYEKAIDYFLKAKEVGTGDLFGVNNYIGLSYYNLRNYKFSKDYFEEALKNTNDKQKLFDTNKILKEINNILNKESNIKIETSISSSSGVINMGTGVLNNKDKVQVEKIFNKLEKKYSKLDKNKKIDAYIILSKKLSIALKKSKSTKFNNIIGLLIEKIDNYINENSNDLENDVLNIINN